MVTASGISVIIVTCFIILSLFNSVMTFKIAFTSSALVMLFNFKFTTFNWLNTRSISALECGTGYITCVDKTSQCFVWDFSNDISIQAYFSPFMLMCHQHFANGQLSNSANGIHFTQWLHSLSQIYPKIRLKIL